MPKIDESMEENEFSVEIPYSDSLAALDAKSIKVKVEDKDGKEIIGHYFDPKQLQDEDHRVKVLTIPADLLKNFKNQKLVVAIKQSKMGFFEQNLFKKEVSLIGLGASNNITKTQTQDKLRFDVIVRIRQAYNKKENTMVQSNKVVVEKFYQAFDEFKSAPPVPA